MKKQLIFIFLVPLMTTAQNKAKSKKDTIGEKSIKEVVITSSYGTKKLKEEVVGAITTISAKEIATTQAFESVDKMIAGLSPGVQIENTSSLGNPVNINIRGLGSLVNLSGNRIGTSTQPLIIIDGIIMKEDIAFDNLVFDGGTNSEQLINPLARISVDNIESINILRDAAAVALYGADAANGVIIISTKKGQKGKPKFSFNSQFGISNPINRVKYLNVHQYIDLYNAYQSNLPRPSYIQYDGTDVDWFNVMNQPGDLYRTNFGVSGGNSWFNYRVGLEYSKNNEAKIINNLERKGVDATLGFKLGKMDVSVFSSYSTMVKEAPNRFFNLILAPNKGIYNPDGSFIFHQGIPNPLAAATLNRDNTKTNALLSSINASYQIFDGLKISSIFGVDYSVKEDYDWAAQAQYDGVNDRIRSQFVDSNTFKWNFSSQLFYEKQLGKHYFDFLGGFEARETIDKKERHSAIGFSDYFTPQMPWDSPNYILASGQPNIVRLTSENAGISYFGQLNYDFQKKYFFSGTLRRDASSAFGDDKNAAINGGIGISWILSNEFFFKNQNWLDFLRIRSSWGMTGNSRIGSYRSSGLYNLSVRGFTYDFPYAIPNNSAPQNRELGWEKNEKWNLGIDINVFKKIQFNIDLYRNNISDMITSPSLNLETGYTSGQINGGAMYNQGIEFNMKVDWFKRKGFNWSTNFNVSTVDNMVTDLYGYGDANSAGAVARARRINSPTSGIWGYQWVGINPLTGRDLYLINGVPTEAIAGGFTSNNAQNWVMIGNSQPDAIGGMRNNFSYKNFSLGFQMNFEIGGDYLVENELIDQYVIMINRNMSVNALDYWTPTNPNAANHLPINNNRIIGNSTKYLYDNTFIKLQNVNFSYKLEFNKKEKMFIKDVTIYGDITNVAYWYKQKSPEGKNGIREFRYLYPEMQTISFGFRMNF